MGVIIVGTAALLAWAHGGYLACLKLFLHLLPDSSVPPSAPLEPPFVTLVVVAHNEQALIADKIDNSLALDWPDDRLDVLIASDGSSDATDAIVEDHPSPRVRLLAASRRGKALMSNEAVKASTAEWLLFTDAETRLEPDFLRRLGPHFAAPEVGMVDGELVCANRNASVITESVGLYWRFESALKMAESELGCLSSTFGSCTALRRTLFEPLLPTEDIDFRTPLDAIAKGYRVVHEPAARAHDTTHSNVRQQYEARVRMVTKNLPGTLRHCHGPVLRRPLVMLGIVSHKLLRWATPVFLLANLVASLRAASRPLGKIALCGHVSLTLGGAAGAWAWRRGQPIPLASSVFSYLIANAGFLIGVINAARGVQIASFEPSEELAGPSSAPAPGREHSSLLA